MSEIVQRNIGWYIVEEEKARNRHVRFNWKEILGISLTRYIARLKTEGKTTNEIYQDINTKHFLTAEHQRRLVIGIAARFGEMATAESEAQK
jgi:hypothetical protein